MWRRPRKSRRREAGAAAARCRAHPPAAGSFPITSANPDSPGGRVQLDESLRADATLVIETLATTSVRKIVAIFYDNAVAKDGCDADSTVISMTYANKSAGTNYAIIRIGGLSHAHEQHQPAAFTSALLSGRYRVPVNACHGTRRPVRSRRNDGHRRPVRWGSADRPATPMKLSVLASAHAGRLRRQWLRMTAGASRAGWGMGQRRKQR